MKTTTTTTTTTETFDPNKVDAQVARELNQLSLQGRSRAIEEIHGIHKSMLLDSNNVEEENKQQMQYKVDRIPIKEAYEEAVRLQSRYIHDKNFRLQFIRTEKYDPKKAAMRMIRFVDFAKELYGPQVLCRPMCLCDFIIRLPYNFMKTGNIQLPRARDAVGRRIIVLLDHFGEF
jgi:hypothetical protein